MSFYETNVSTLSLINPCYASSLTHVEEDFPYEVFIDHENIETLNLIHTKTFQPLYPTKPQDVLYEQLETYTVFEEYPYLYFFGIGNGVLLKQLLSNPKHDRIVVIEPDPCIAYVVFHLLDFSSELQTGRLVLLGREQLVFPIISALFSTFETQRYAKLYDLHVMSSFYEIYATLITSSNRLFIECLHQTIQTIGNDAKDSLIGLKQHIINLPLVPKTPQLLDLFKKVATTDVAVLVSTGPSLDKQLDLLKKIAPYVRIFAVDASLPVLIKQGIKPDVVVSIERVATSSHFFKEITCEDMNGIITVLSSLQHSDVINSVAGGEKLISLRPLGYMMLTGPKEWGYVGIGMSAANMAYELIYHSHFKTCLLIGQDLAYGEDGKSHAHGHVFGENEVKESEKDGWTVAYGGEGHVRTTAIWNMFRGFFEKDIAETKEHMLTINATEGGARIFGALELPFKKAIALHVKDKTPKNVMKLTYKSVEEQQTIVREVWENVAMIRDYCLRWQKNVEVLFLDVAQACERCDAKELFSLEDAKGLVERIYTMREVFKEEIFDKVIWHIAQSMLFVQELFIAPIEVRLVCDEKDKYTKMVDLLYAYKPWLFSLAGCIDSIVKTIDYGYARQLIYRVKTIEVVAENRVIDSITCKEMQAQKGHVFDVDMRGILYVAPEEYTTKEITFRDAQTKDGLPPSFVSVLTPDDEKYNELSFIVGLEAELSEESLNNAQILDVIGFLATEKNLEDREFIYFVKLLQQQNYGVPFVVFYFNTSQQQKALKVFGEDAKYVIPKSLADIINNVSIYLYSHLSRETSFETDRKTREKLMRYAQKIFVIDLKKKIEGDAFVQSVALCSADKKINFSESIISRVLKGHEKFNEYRFLNSLAFVDEAKVKDLYCPNAIGFLATEENLSDEEFVGYIKELMVRFPEVEFKGFCFTDEQNFLCKKIYSENVVCSFALDITTLANYTMIYIHNGLNVEKANILLKLIGYRPFIYFNQVDYEMTLRQNEEKYADELLQVYGVDIFKKSFYIDYIGIGEFIPAQTLRKEYSYSYIESVLNSPDIRAKIIKLKV